MYACNFQVDSNRFKSDGQIKSGLMKEGDKRVYYGWCDVANFQQAIIFYAEMAAKGHYAHEIHKMLDGYFPRIDYITVGRIRVKAWAWMRNLVSDIEKKIYLAKSIVRLERICANHNEKTRNVLTADAALTHLLGLADVAEQASPEQMANFLLAFNKAAKSATDGTAYTAAEEAAKNPAPEPEKSSIPESESEPTTAPTMPLDEEHQTEEEKEIDVDLIALRATRLKTDINNLSEEIKKDNERHRRQQQESQNKQEEIDLSVYDED